MNFAKFLRTPFLQENLQWLLLAIALRFVPSGNSQTSLSYNFKIGKTTICGIVEEVCEAIWTVLMLLLNQILFFIIISVSLASS